MERHAIVIAILLALLVALLRFTKRKYEKDY